MSDRRRGPAAVYAERRRELVGAATAIAAERGVTAVTLAAVAARAGVSPGRVQHYFPTKDDLLAAVFDEIDVATSVRVRARVGSDPLYADPRTVLEAVLRELIPDHPTAVAHARFRHTHTGPAAGLEGTEEPNAPHRRRHHVDPAELIGSEQQRGRIVDGLDPVVVARNLMALGEGLAHYVLIGACDVQQAETVLLGAVDRLYVPSSAAVGADGREPSSPGARDG